ncbi:MAG: hypothetical protein V4629_10105, partial [Pseudomonadota bacterium]
AGVIVGLRVGVTVGAGVIIGLKVGVIVGAGVIAGAGLNKALEADVSLVDDDFARSPPQAVMEIEVNKTASIATKWMILLNIAHLKYAQKSILRKL